MSQKSFGRNQKNLAMITCHQHTIRKGDDDDDNGMVFLLPFQ